MGRWVEIKCNCSDREPVKPHERFGEYKCGHKDGMFLQFYPGDLFDIGYALEDALGKDTGVFEVFTKIGNWRLYDDEYLPLTSGERDLWQLEIEQLKRYLSGEQSMGWREMQIFQQKIEHYELLYGSIEETLEDGLSLINASRSTGNPIEFYW